MTLPEPMVQELDGGVGGAAVLRLPPFLDVPTQVLRDWDGARAPSFDNLEKAIMQATTSTPDKARGARLEARVSSAQKALFQRAAELSTRTLSEFVVASAQEAATRIIQENEAIRLTRAEQIAFVSALLDPPEPNARLCQAAKKYRTQMAA